MDKDIVFTFESPDADAVAAYKMLNENLSDVLRKLEFISERADELEAKRNDPENLRDRAAKIKAHDSIVLDVLKETSQALLSMDVSDRVVKTLDDIKKLSGYSESPEIPFGSFVTFLDEDNNRWWGVFNRIKDDRYHFYYLTRLTSNDLFFARWPAAKVRSMRLAPFGEDISIQIRMHKVADVMWDPDGLRFFNTDHPKQAVLGPDDD